MLISLKESEIAELSAPHRLEPSPTVQPHWQVRQFASTGRHYHCVIDDDGTVVIKMLREADYLPRIGLPLWM